MKTPRPFQEKRIVAVSECLHSLGVQGHDHEDANPLVYWSTVIPANAIHESTHDFANRFNALITEKGIRLVDGPIIVVSDECVHISMASGYPKFMTALLSTCASDISVFLKNYIDEICTGVDIQHMTNPSYIADKIRAILLREKDQLIQRETIVRLSEDDAVKNLRIAQFYRFTDPKMSNQEAVVHVLGDGLLNPIKIGQYLYYADKFLQPFGYEVDRASLYYAVEKLLNTDFFGIFPLQADDGRRVVNREEIFDPLGSFLRREEMNEILEKMNSPECKHQKCPAMTPKVWKEYMEFTCIIMQKAEEPHQEYLSALRDRILHDAKGDVSLDQYAQVGCFVRLGENRKIIPIAKGDACLQPFEDNPFLRLREVS